MKRKILGFDPTDGEFIRSENHKKSLLSSDWMGSHAQNAEDVVNSDVDREVYPIADRAAPYGVNSMLDRSSGLLKSSNLFVQKVQKNTKNISASMFDFVFIV
jgi:hypothetical protein